MFTNLFTGPDLTSFDLTPASKSNWIQLPKMPNIYLNIGPAGLECQNNLMGCGILVGQIKYLTPVLRSNMVDLT